MTTLNEARIREDAVSYCDMIGPGYTCAIMTALSTESDPRCKCWRDPAEGCRYLRLFIMRQPKRRG